MRKTASKVVIALILIGLMTSCVKEDRVEVNDFIPPETNAEIPPEDPYINPDLDYLVLVDSSHPLPEDWEELIEVECFTNAVGDEVKVERTAYEAYLKLKETLEKENVYVDLDSAYRSVAEQQEIIDDFTKKYGAEYARAYAAAPGYSEHHTGLALDLFIIIGDEIIYENEDLMQYPEIWEKVHEKLPNYGFILRYPGGNGYAYEPWHIRYVGLKAAQEITEKDLYFEDYIKSMK